MCYPSGFMLFGRSYDMSLIYHSISKLKTLSCRKSTECSFTLWCLQHVAHYRYLLSIYLKNPNQVQSKIYFHQLIKDTSIEQMFSNQPSMCVNVCTCVCICTSERQRPSLLANQHCLVNAVIPSDILLIL
jgi:hypothetical protein